VAVTDLLTSTFAAEFGTAYSNYKTTNATRTNVVYNGANDGMLHAFRAGKYTAAGVFDTTSTNDGYELFAYMPDAVVTSIHSPSTPTLDFSSPSYSHNFYVDATPGTGDLYYSGAWHTWLVGGLGAGGNKTGATNGSLVSTVSATATTTTDVGAIFALDITAPDSFVAANVKGEWNSNAPATSAAALVCDNNATCYTNMGAQYGTPIIRRLHNGQWAIIFGNGRNSSTGAAGIFVMTIDSTGTNAGKVAHTYYIGTPSGYTNATTKNGIEYVTSADLDSDHITDYIYAGDALGNVWRFDLRDSVPATWYGTAPKLLFTAVNAQPISTRVTVSSVVQASGSPRVIINFGTGRATPQTLNAANGYDTGTQYLYGIWDWDMTVWNSKSSVNYASAPVGTTYNADNLTAQKLNDVVTSGSTTISGYRTETTGVVCWSGSAYCTTDNTKFGWKVPLPATNEQIIYSPVVTSGVLYFNTYIPGVDQTLSCTTQAASGFTMAISPATGGALVSSAFSTAVLNAGITNTSGAIIVGIGASATGTPSFVTAGNNTFLVQQTVSGTGVVLPVDLVGATKGKRVTWVKLR